MPFVVLAEPCAHTCITHCLRGSAERRVWRWQLNSFGIARQEEEWLRRRSSSSPPFGQQPNDEYNQNLPELTLIEGKQQVAIKRDEPPRSPFVPILPLFTAVGITLL